MSSSFGRYVVEGPLGQGGMGVVYRGHDPMLDRTVAIKVLQIARGTTESNQEQFRERFFREARSAARLSHPHIVTVHDVGVTEDQSPYLVMELIEGESLQALLERERRIGSERVAKIGVAIAAALQCAHDAGVVHRDVKPANILLGSDGSIKLMDFGLARVAESTLTVSGQFLGSPLFSSPEQMRGHDVGPASDIFALGLTLWVLLTGTHPFRRATLQETVRAIVLEQAKAPTAVVPTLGSSWDIVLGQALAKDPALRFASAADFGYAVGATGRGELLGPIDKAPPPPPPLELHVEQGPDLGLRITLDRDLTVGRGRGDLALSDGGVSGQHCVLAVRAGNEVTVDDAGSTNGTFVDEQRVQIPTRVDVGARIRLGPNTVLRVHQTEARTAPAPVAGTMLDGSTTGAATRPSLAGPAFALFVEDGPRKGSRILLTPALVLSRDDGDGRLDDPKVSRKHASVEVRAGRVFVRDLASTNGTWLNDDRVREVEIRVGDQFRVGNSTLRLDRAR